MILRRTIAVAVLLCCGSIVCAEEKSPAPLIHGSVHRDQTYPRPLQDSLDMGFCSIEVDVHMAGDEFLVGHDRPEPGRTFRALYLDPLRQRCKANGGRVFPGGPTFTLLIDIKTEGRASYAALRKVLAQYADILTVIDGDKVVEKGVTAVVSGNVRQAWKDILADSPQYGSIDGRVSYDMGSDLSPAILPLVSDHWGRHFKWRGRGPMPPEEQAKLRDIVQKAHKQGRRVRFWATPDAPAFWKELRAAGVDLINTDQPKRLKEFLTAELRVES